MRKENLVNDSETQKIYKFNNGYGASVIFNDISYGHEEGLWELAVIKWNEDKWSLCYDTEITNDVIGYLNEDEVDKLLVEISKLEADENDI